MNHDEAGRNLVLPDDELDVAIENLILQLAMFLEEEDEEGEEDEANDDRQWGGSRPGKAPNKNRNFSQADRILREHYFSGEASIYDEHDFERRFRMPRSVFIRVYEGVVGRGTFIQHCLKNGQPGITPLCRVVAAMRVICYGIAADAQDEIFQLGESTTIAAVKELCQHIVEIFGAEC
jgi:hypothetical protein